MPNEFGPRATKILDDMCALMNHAGIDAVEKFIETLRGDRKTEPPLTPEEVNRFRQLPGSFDSMVNAIWQAGVQGKRRP